MPARESRRHEKSSRSAFAEAVPALTRVPRMRLVAVTGVPADLYVQTLILGVLLGVLGGLLPAYRATQISPAAALRYE
ncbi:MAG TPA: hypothetical protein VEZ44_02375 [bacterium]|nr:hypothetical protein [bacterium]